MLRAARVPVGALFALLGGLACSPIRPVTAEQCRNLLDDDFDGVADCDDPDCAWEASCADLEPFSPTLPGWLDPEGAIPDLGPRFDAPCDSRAHDDRRVYAVGCGLVPDDCAAGLRCVPLSIDGRLETGGCVRRGCGEAYESCEPGGGPADACGKGTLCAQSDLCRGGPCCLPVCVPEAGTCGDCRPLGADYPGGWIPEAASLAAVGLCHD